MADQNTIAVRLALRSEGEYVNAYYASEGTMKDAILLGSLRRNLAEDERIFELWTSAMKHALEITISETIGCDVTFGDPEPAPEHERSGRG